MALLLDVRDPRRKRLLFRYDPIEETVWIKDRDGELVVVSLPAIKGANAALIASYISPPPERL